MYYQNYKRKEEIKNVACVWNNINLKTYIDQLTERSKKQLIGIENK
jgi:hypothetical protein